MKALRPPNQVAQACVNELVFTTSRSSGSGGQHVNKVETRVTLRWAIKDSEELLVDERAVLLEKLDNYVNKEGVMVVHCDTKRSQLRNKELVIARWKKLIKQAFHVPKPRKPSRPSAASREQRRSDKKRRSEVKTMRGKVKWD